MTPMLYASVSDIWTDSLTSLDDCVSCTVSEDLDGKYELKMVYPESGHAAELFEIGQVISACPNAYRLLDNDAKYLYDFFTIYKVTRSPGSMVTVNAEHICYQLAKEVCPIFSATNLADAFTKIGTLISGDLTFNWQAAVGLDGAYTQSNPTTVREVVKKLATEFQRMVEPVSNLTQHYIEIRFYTDRARNIGKPWNYFYGANIKTFSENLSDDNAYTHIFPYYRSGNTFVRIASSPYKVATGWTPGSGNNKTTKPVDLTDRFQSTPSQAALLAKATSYVTEQTWGPTMTLTIEPAPELAYKPIMIGDHIDAYINKYGIGKQSSVIQAYEWDVIRERYSKLTIGTIRTTLGVVLNNIAGGIAP